MASVSPYSTRIEGAYIEANFLPLFLPSNEGTEREYKSCCKIPFPPVKNKKNAYFLTEL
jgi:hypothetical protein